MRIPITKEGNLKQQIDKCDEKIYELILELEKKNERRSLSKAYDLLLSALTVVDTIENRIGPKRVSFEKTIRARIIANKLEVSKYVILNDELRV